MHVDSVDAAAWHVQLDTMCYWDGNMMPPPCQGDESLVFETTQGVGIPIATITPASALTIHSQVTNREAVLDFGGDSLTVTGDLPLTDAAKEFSKWAHWYITGCYRDALREALKFAPQTEAEKAMSMVQTTYGLYIYPLTRPESLRREADAIEHRDSTVVALRKIWKDGCE